MARPAVHGDRRPGHRAEPTAAGLRRDRRGRAGQPHQRPQLRGLRVRRRRGDAGPTTAPTCPTPTPRGVSRPSPSIPPTTSTAGPSGPTGRSGRRTPAIDWTPLDAGIHYTDVAFAGARLFLVVGTSTDGAGRVVRLATPKTATDADLRDAANRSVVAPGPARPPDLAGVGEDRRRSVATGHRLRPLGRRGRPSPRDLPLAQRRQRQRRHDRLGSPARRPGDAPTRSRATTTSCSPSTRPTRRRRDRPAALPVRVDQRRHRHRRQRALAADHELGAAQRRASTPTSPTSTTSCWPATRSSAGPPPTAASPAASTGAPAAAPTHGLRFLEDPARPAPPGAVRWEKRDHGIGGAQFYDVTQHGLLPGSSPAACRTTAPCSAPGA